VFLIKHGEDYPFHNSPRLKVRSVENWMKTGEWYEKRNLTPYSKVQG
jgi:hypothetical protein